MSTTASLQQLPVEQRLWRRVIIRAWEEAHGRHIYTEDVALMKHHAQKWLTHETKSLRQVCELAGYSRLEMQQMMKNCRKEFGEKK